MLMGSLVINLVLNFVGASTLTGGNEDAETVALHLAGASLFHFILGISLLQLGILFMFPKMNPIFEILILAPLLDIVKNFFPAWFEWITGKPLMEIGILTNILTYFALFMAGCKHVIIDRKTVYQTIEIVNEEFLRYSSKLEHLGRQKRYSRQERNFFSETSDRFERQMIKEVEENNLNQRLIIYFGLVVYHLVVSYLYASLAGEWMD